MDTPVTVAIISAAAAAIVAPAISFYLTKSKERQADWQRYKFELYKEFVHRSAASLGPTVLQRVKEDSRLRVIRFI